MSILRWLVEERWRGPVGTLDRRVPEVKATSLPQAVLRASISVAMVAFLVMLLWDGIHTAGQLGLAVLITFLYGLIAYFTDARPARENMGAWGGLIDRTFRATDDYNRILAFIAIVVWPGRFVAGSLRDLWRMRRTTSRLSGHI